MNKINKNRIMAVLISGILLSLTACGNDAEESISVNDEIIEEVSEEIPEEIVTEKETVIPYWEKNEMTFTDKIKVTTKGTLCASEDTDNIDIIDVDWELANISINTEDDSKIINIEQVTYGYIWKDGDNVLKTNINLPSAVLVDINTGKIIPMKEEITTTEIGWDEEKYSIETIEEVNWEDGNSWIEDDNGGKRLTSNLVVTDTIKITNNYDGLALVLLPIKNTDNSIIGNYIMDIWTDGSYLFNINDMNDILIANAEKEIEKTVDVDSEEVTKEESKTETAKTNETTSTTTNTTQKEESKTVAHTHNYSKNVTTQATCTVSGVLTYTCSCGDSYTENLGTSAHDYSVPITESVYHEEQWTTVARQLSEQKVYWCGCGAEYTNVDEFEAHRVANVEANGPFVDCAGNYMIYTRPGETVYDRVKVSDAYTSEEIVGYKCSICGATQ